MTSPFFQQQTKFNHDGAQPWKGKQTNKQKELNQDGAQLRPNQTTER